MPSVEIGALYDAYQRKATTMMAALTLLCAGPLVAQSPTHVVAPGITYRHVNDARGPWDMHIVRIDLKRADLALQAARARDSLRGRERTSVMAKRANALVAVNADFFDLRTGENENQQVLAGEWWKGLKVTDSPYDTFDNVHAQLAIDARGRASIARYALNAHAWARSLAPLGMPILTVNAPPTGTYEGTVLYTPRYGASTPRDTSHGPTGPKDVDAPDVTRPVAEAPLVTVGQRGDTTLYVRRGAVTTTAGTSIPADGVVLSAYGPRAAAVKALGEGDTVKIRLATLPALGTRPSLVIGGWPRIIADGVNIAAEAATVEGTISRNAEARHPRTAVGVTRDGSTLVLFVVDGRSKASVGMTLVEMADVLRGLGVWNALNFDGGGSSAMVVDGAVVNVPSDPQGEREVGNALLVVKRRR